MSINLLCIPEFSYFEYKVKNPINLAKALDFIQQKINSGEIFQSNETLFWTVALLYRLNKLDLLNKEVIKKFVIELKYQDGGFKFSANTEEPDTWSTFYCISSLKILGLDEIIEDKDIDFILNSQVLGFGSDGGFIHCKLKNCYASCNGKTSVKSSYFALSTLILLNKLEKVDQKRLLYLLKKDTQESMELIYQILSLKLVNELELINLEKKIPIVTSWQIPKAGFGIDSKFPSVTDTIWAGICLGLLDKLELIDFGGIINFLKTMQQENGGFTNQYSSISSKEPTLLSTSQCLIALFYFWNNLIENIENEILLRARDFSDVYLIPITEKFSVPLTLIEEISKFLISNKWIEGEILDKSDVFQKFYNQQIVASQEIIKKVMKQTESFQKQKELDLTEFSKTFDFSNPLEKVKLVINDLIINKFITGTIKAYKKKYILENFSLPGKFLHLLKPIPYTEIMNEKKQKIEDKNKLIKLSSDLTDILEKISKIIQELIEKEKISEARKELEENIKSADDEINKFEKIIKEINSNYKFIDFKLYNYIFEKTWPNIKVSIKGLLVTTKSDLEQKINEKEEFISKRSKQTKEQKEINNIRDILKEITNKLKLYLVEIKNFFPKNYTDHKATLQLINTILKYINDSDSNLNSKISEVSTDIKFDQFKKDINNINTSWTKEKEESIEKVKSHQIKIEKRIEMEKLIANLISELGTFSNEKNAEILALINENKLDQSADSLNEVINKFNDMVIKQTNAFNEFLNKTNNEISDFSKFSMDLNSDWTKKLKDEQNKWDNVLSDIRGKLHSDLELKRKEDLRKKTKEYIEDLNKIIKNMKESISKLVECDEIIKAEKNNNEIYDTINQKIKSYVQEYKDFIKSSTRDFKNFRETVADLTENWESEKEKIIQYLDEASKELKTKIDEKGCGIEKIELENMIKKQISDIENNIDQFKLGYNQILESGKKVIDFENKLEEDLAQLYESLKTADYSIKTFIKTTLKTYYSFEDLIAKEVDSWNDSKSKIEKELESISKKIEEEILIMKVQSMVTAFKGNKIDLTYLSKSLKTKLEPLKLKLIGLISNSKLIGEFDSTSNAFFLKEERKPEKFIIEEKERIKKEKIEKVADDIKEDILKIRYLMLIHNEVGATIYSRKLGDWQLDADLIGGFLTAIQSFGSEIKKETIPIHSMQYKGFEIIMERGKFILAAIFIDGKESNWIREKSKKFVDEFEKEFEELLKNWKGEVAAFKRAGLLADKVFELFRV